jgi:hypothetical protein
VPGDGFEIVREPGQSAIQQMRTREHGTRVVTIPSPRTGLGYSTVFLKSGSSESQSVQRFNSSVKLGDGYCSAQVTAGGILNSVTVDHRRMLAGEGNRWICVRGGKDESPAPVKGSARVERGTMYEAAESHAELGTIQLKSRISLRLPFHFDVETELDFREPTEIGDYFDDRTKLHIAWNVGKDVEITYLSGGCPDYARPGKSFIAYPALSVNSKRGSLTFCFESAVKAWLDEDGILRFVIAWDTTATASTTGRDPLAACSAPSIGSSRWTCDCAASTRSDMRYGLTPARSRSMS